MCGIAGALDLTGTREFPAPRLRAMTAAIAHRGPDDEHLHLEPGRRPRRPPALHRRPRRRPAADRQRGRLRLGRLQRRALRLPRAPQDAPGPRPPPGHPLRHRGLGPPLRGPRRRPCSSTPAASSPSRSGTADRRTLILGRDRVGICPLYYAAGRRLAALGLGGQGAAGLGAGRGAARPDGGRPPLPLLLRRHDADLLRGGQVAAAGALPRGRATAGSRSSRYWDLDFPDAGEERRARRPDARWSTSWRALLRPGGRASAAGRRAGGQLHQRRARLDGRAGPELATARAGAVPSFTIGLDRAGPDERPQATESAEVLGSPLTTVTMDRAEIAAAFPELIRRRRGAGPRHLVRRACAAGRGRSTARATRWR